MTTTIIVFVMLILTGVSVCAVMGTDPQACACQASTALLTASSTPLCSCVEWSFNQSEEGLGKMESRKGLSVERCDRIILEKCSTICVKVSCDKYKWY